MAKCYTNPTFLQWFWQHKSCNKFFLWFQIFTKCVFLRIWALNIFFLKDNIFGYKQKIGNQAHFPNVRWKVPFDVWNGRKSNPFRHFLISLRKCARGMVTSFYEWNHLEWDVKQFTTNISMHTLYCHTFILVEYFQNGLRSFKT